MVNLDNLTYAGNVENLAIVLENPSHIFVEGNSRLTP
jgi:dTDP-D-glucose 4,6-dehydratase